VRPPITPQTQVASEAARRINLPVFASRFKYKSLLSDGPLFPKQSKRLQVQGSLSQEDLHDLALWKSARSAGNVRRNDHSLVEKLTRAALRLADDPDLPASVPISVLTLLDGVGVPTASVILTVWHPDRYGIIDRNAWSALFDCPQVRPREFEPREYDYYLQILTALADSTKLMPREVDMALYTWWIEERERSARP
jgi:hypothetical protein